MANELNVVVARATTSLTSDGETVYHPDLPPDILNGDNLWGFAGNLPDETSEMLIWVDSDISDLPPENGVKERVGQAINPVEYAPIKAVKATDPVARRDFVQAYRGVASVKETTEKTAQKVKDTIKRARDLLILFGAGLATWFLLRELGSEGVKIAALLIASDDFNRANNPINGQTMSDGTNVWFPGAGYTSMVISSNRIQAVGGIRAAHTKTPGILTDCEADLTDVWSTSTTKEVGPTARDQGGAVEAQNLYYSFFNGVNVTLRRRIAGVLTTLGTTAQAVDGSPHSLGIRAVGSILTSLWDSAVIVGPSTDTNFASGYVGITGANSPRFSDNFDAYDLTGGAGGDQVQIENQLHPARGFHTRVGPTP